MTSDVANSLRVALLGPVRVVARGEDVTDRIRARPLSLLKALAGRHPSGLPRDVLAEILWPKSDPPAAYVSLKVATHNLRRSLGSEARDEHDWIRAHGGIYRLSEDVWVDSVEFERQIAAGKEADAVRDVRTAQRHYRAALSLYRGDYLEDDIYDDWALLTRERLRDLHLHALGRLAATAAAEHDYLPAIEYAHEIITNDPCREDIYQILLLAHGALGQFSRVDAWYAVARQTVERELGRELGQKTIDIYRRLRPFNV